MPEPRVDLDEIEISVDRDGGVSFDCTLGHPWIPLPGGFTIDELHTEFIRHFRNEHFTVVDSTVISEQRKS